MIEVLHLIDTYRTGGPGKTIINSARFIDRHRYRIHVASFTNDRPESREFATAVGQAGIPYLELRERRRVDPTVLAQLRAYIRRQHVTVLHTHGYRSDVLGYVLTRGMPGVALVTTHHGWIRNNWRQVLATQLASLLSTRFDGIELVTECLRDELPRALRQTGRVAVVHNAIVAEDFVAAGRRDGIRRECGFAPRDLVIGVVGRLSPEKGPADMVRAFGIVAQRIPEAHLVFVGEGPLEPELKREVDRLGLGARVRFAGYQAQVQPYYEAFDLVASPSHTEGLSNVLLEAMTFGRPIVATRVGGNPEIIRDGRAGLLVTPRMPDEMAAALIALLTDAEWRSRLAAEAAHRVRTAFSFPQRMRQEERFYEEVLARIRHRRGIRSVAKRRTRNGRAAGPPEPE